MLDAQEGPRDDPVLPSPSCGRFSTLPSTMACTRARIPLSKVKKPSGDNKRVRFLTHEEAEALLDTIREKERSTCTTCRRFSASIPGCAPGKSSALTWADVDLRRPECSPSRTLKTGRTRFARMTDACSRDAVLSPEGPGRASLVFPARAPKENEEAELNKDKDIQDLRAGRRCARAQRGR